MPRRSLKLAGGRVVRPVPTRWFSTCAAINSILRIQPVIENLSDRPEYALIRLAPILANTELWNALRNLKTYFDAVAKIIGASECLDSTLGKAFQSLLEFGPLVFRELPLSKQFINVVKGAAMNTLGRILIFNFYFSHCCSG